MRSVPAVNSGNKRRPFECRVRFHAPLTNAEFGSPDIIEPVVVSAQSTPITPAATTTQTAPTDAVVEIDPAAFWETEYGRQIVADRERIETILNRVVSAVGELRESQSVRLAEWQRAAVELAMTIATRLLHEKVLTGELPMEAKVRDMIAQLGDDVAVSVRLNPADLEMLKSRLGDKPLLPDRDDLKLLPDATLGRGECRVEGRESMLLSEVSRELQEIRDELLRSLGHARS